MRVNGCEDIDSRDKSSLGLGIGCNFMIDNQLQPTDRLSIIISSSHFCSNLVLEV